MFNFITQASDSIVNFGIGILLARYLGSADYGLYSFLIWFLYFLALFANLGLGQMVIRYIAEAVGRQNQEDLKNVISLALWLRIGIVILVMLIVIIFSSMKFAAALSIGLLPEPHFGECTQDGQPDSQGHALITS